MSIGDAEIKTQERVIRFFKDPEILGYQYIGNLSDYQNKNINEDRLRQYLRLKGYADKLIDAAVMQLQQEAGNLSRGVYDANKTVYSRLKYGIPVSESPEKPPVTVELIDEANPLNNDFAVAEEVTVVEQQEKRPDLVIYGCQSLSTIFNCSESVRNVSDAYIMFRFYEISNAERADEISTCTNSQSAVKARDLRSNDKYVLAMKKAYEQHFTDGYFITKRGENADPVKYNTAHIVDLTSLGKQLIAWHSQRPTISYSESRIFDKYFEQLFHREYSPEKVQALSDLYKEVYKNWGNDNPLGLNEALIALKAYAPYHHLFAVSVLFCEINKMQDLVPNPAVAMQKLRDNDLLDTVIELAGQCLNMGFEIALDDASQNNKVFSPPNWTKAKASLRDIRTAVKQYLMTVRMTPGGKDILDKLNTGLKMSNDDFESRWSAD